MKTELFLAGLLLTTIFISCSTPSYLPKVDEIDVNQYGSYIRISDTTNTIIVGELIAIDSNKLVVLTSADSNKQAKIIRTNEISNFKLRYAKAKNYAWTIPVYTLATIGHGYFAVYTAPFNLIVTISVTASGMSAFQYSNEEMTYDKIRMFARFPQGIPPNIDIASIK